MSSAGGCVAHLGGSIEVSLLIAFCRREALFQRLLSIDVEDVVQQALIELIPRLKSVSNPIAYLRVVIRRIALLSRQSRRSAVALETDGRKIADPVQDPWPESECRIDANRILAPLSVVERKLLSLASQGHTFKEIGGLLGFTSGAARARIFRLRQKLAFAT
jgi:RNA polymerase sigma factor (sigma-70 family)